MDIALILTALALIGVLMGALYRRREIFQKHFIAVLRLSKGLSHYRLTGGRPYRKYYFEREQDKGIRFCLNAGKALVIVGPPLSGKSRAALEAIRSLWIPHFVNVLRLEAVDASTFKFPARIFPLPVITVVDDLHRFVELTGAEHAIREAMEHGGILVATCRSGHEWEKAKHALTQKVGMDVESVFGESIKLEADLTPDQAETIARESGADLSKARFNGTVGSIFMKLGEMSRRFTEECTDDERRVLRWMRSLYLCGLYHGAQEFPEAWVLKGCGVSCDDYAWKSLTKQLKELEFVKRTDHSLLVEETVIEDAVTPLEDVPLLGLIRSMRETFKDEPTALNLLGDKAQEVGSIDLDIAAFMHEAIDAHNAALGLINRAGAEKEYARILVSLGNAYGTLAVVENPAGNCTRAIEAYENALTVYTESRFPLEYAGTQHNLGTAYGTLAVVENPAGNCTRAIEAYENALTVRTNERFPMDYAMTQNNLGAAYRKLAVVEKQAENCSRAMEAYENALTVYTKDRFPLEYAGTQNNLGAAHQTHAEVDEKAGNCKLAIEAYEKALTIFTKGIFPMRHATIQNNLGNAYGTFAEVEDKTGNCTRAIEAYENALTVRTEDRFPMDYAGTQNNLGGAYGTLAEVEDKAGNCKRAIKAFKEAEAICEREGIFVLLEHVRRNIARLERFCAEGDQPPTA